jgi:hypothetical protein
MAKPKAKRKKNFTSMRELDLQRDPREIPKVTRPGSSRTPAKRVKTKLSNENVIMDAGRGLKGALGTMRPAAYKGKKAAKKIKRSGPPVLKSRPITSTDKAQRARVMTVGKARRIIANSRSSNNPEFQEAARFLAEHGRRKRMAAESGIKVAPRRK